MPGGIHKGCPYLKGGRALVAIQTKVERGGRKFSCKKTSFSVWSPYERREPFKAILSSSSCVKD